MAHTLLKRPGERKVPLLGLESPLFVVGGVTWGFMELWEFG
jgi:hypothetical protein